MEAKPNSLRLPVIPVGLSLRLSERWFDRAGSGQLITGHRRPEANSQFANHAIRFHPPEAVRQRWLFLVVFCRSTRKPKVQSSNRPTMNGSGCRFASFIEPSSAFAWPEYVSNPAGIIVPRGASDVKKYPTFSGSRRNQLGSSNDPENTPTQSGNLSGLRNIEVPQSSQK